MARICIITVAAGPDSGLADTLASVDQQTTHPFRHILVLNRVPATDFDGNNQPAFRDCVIDRDKSLYNAMNIGLSRATGDLVVFLNGGDTLYRHNTLQTINRKWDGKSIIVGRALQVFGSDLYVRPAVGRLADLHQSASHQAFYCPLTKPLPTYDESGTIGADSRWMKQVRSLHSQQCINDILCRFGLGGVSNAPSLRTVRRRFLNDGLAPSIKELAKLCLHRSVGQKQAYRILYRNRFGRCVNRPERAYQFP